MEQYVGLDVSQRVTPVCIIDAKAQIVWQGKCPSTPQAVFETIRSHAQQVERIGLESGPLSTWHYHGLKDLGVPTVCIDARHTQAALSMQINKTDKNDGKGIAELMRMGWFRAVAVKALDSHTIRAMLGARFKLVGMRTNIINQMRAIIKI